MQQDILCFAARTLVEGGRIAMWMPTADDQDIELMIPTHPSLEIVSVSVQQFNGCELTGFPHILYCLTGHE